MVLTQRSLAGGELAPALHSRVDTVKYATGVRTMRNFQVMKSGGAENRPGTIFVGNYYDADETVRLIPYIINNQVAYTLEFTDEKVRVIVNGEYVTFAAPFTVTAFSNASPALITTTISPYSFFDDDIVIFSGLVTNAVINGAPMKIRNSDDVTTFELYNFDGTPYTSLGAEATGTFEVIKSIESPFIESEIFDIYYSQNGEDMILTHPDHVPQLFNSTTISTQLIGLYPITDGVVPPLGAAVSGVAGTANRWLVTSVQEDTYIESTRSSIVGSSTVASSGAPRTISWTSVAGYVEYNIYKEKNGVFGYIGTAVGSSFIDNGIEPDVTSTAPVERNPFSATGDYPAIVGSFQQRLAFGNTDNNPEGVWLSKSGSPGNFNIHSPFQADDPVTFTMLGRQVNSIRHFLDLEKPVVLTQGGEHFLGGDEAGILRPDAVNPTQFGYSGASKLIPIAIGNNFLFVQALGSIIRDVGFKMQQDGFNTNDLTVFATHLFKNKTIVDWAYQQVPNSIIWAVQSDGSLIALTYVPEHQIFAWHRHDFASVGTFSDLDNASNATVESVTVIPEDGNHVVYLVIKRGDIKCLECFSLRNFTDITSDAIFLDSSLTYDGRNDDDTHTMSIPAGDYDVDEEFTLTSSASFFASTDVGNEIHFTDPVTEAVYRLKISAYLSATTVTVYPKNVEIEAASPIVSSAWSRAVDSVGGLYHLNDSEVSVFADGFVLSSPLNDGYPTLTVEDNELTLDNCYSVIHVGLPYVSDIETLNIDTAEGQSIVDKKKLVTAVNLYVDNTRGLWVGENPGDDSVTNLVEPKVRDEELHDDPVTPVTGTMEQNILSEWNSNGRILIRQVDPLPATILGVAPAGMFPFRG